MKKNMSYQYLLLEVSQRVATVTINRPDKGNALAPDVLLEVTAMFNELGTRDDVNVIVFTGGSDIFPQVLIWVRFANWRKSPMKPTPSCFIALTGPYYSANNQSYAPSAGPRSRAVSI